MKDRFGEKGNAEGYTRENQDRLHTAFEHDVAVLLTTARCFYSLLDSKVRKTGGAIEFSFP